MRESITTNQFLVTILLNILNTILVSIIYVKYYDGDDDDVYIFFRVVVTPLIINSIYLFINLICDFSLYVCKSIFLEKLNYYNRNFYCHICNPFSYTFVFIIPLVYIFVTIFVITDIIVHEHNKIEFDFKIGIWLFIISSLLLYLIRNHFMGFFLIYLAYMILFLSYLFQIYFVNKYVKNKNINDINQKEETKKENQITSTLI